MSLYTPSARLIVSVLAVLTPLPAVAGGVVLNELMWGGEEYIELYNADADTMSLEGWSITRQKPGGDEQTILEIDGVVASGAYFLIERNEEATTVSGDMITSFRLVNSGELVRLYNHDGVLIDEANRQDAWFAGSSVDGGYSMERISPGSGGTVKESWVTSGGSGGGRHGTPGAPYSDNSQDADESAEEEGKTGEDEPVLHEPYPDGVVINEILPNPAGSDSEKEFIELYNASPIQIDLAGWRLDDEKGGSNPYTIPEGVVIAGRTLLVFYRSQTKIALNNNGDQVRLLSPDAVEQSSFTYAGSIGEGYSYNRVRSGQYAISTTPTPGADNVVTIPDGVASRGSASSPLPTVQGATAAIYPRTIVISEFLPDPVGSDSEGEFIELHNTGAYAVDVSGWQLDDAEGGSKPYTIPDGTNIAAGAYVQFSRARTGIALNNSGDSARLIDPDGVVVSSYSYEEKVPEGQSYNRTVDGSYVLSDVPTPGAVNSIVQLREDEPRQPSGEVAGLSLTKRSNKESTGSVADGGGARTAQGEQVDGVKEFNGMAGAGEAGPGDTVPDGDGTVVSSGDAQVHNTREQAKRSMAVTLGVGVVIILTFSAVTNKEPLLAYAQKLRSFLTKRGGEE